MLASLGCDARIGSQAFQAYRISSPAELASDDRSDWR